MCVSLAHLGVLEEHDPGDQEDDDGDRGRDDDDYHGVAFLWCLQATVGRVFLSLNCGVCATTFDERGSGEVRQTSTFCMQLFDLSWQGAGNTGAGAGTLTVTVFVTNVVGATKAVVSTVTGTPRS